MAIEDTELPNLEDNHEIEPRLWIDECCIYKVPENLRQQKSEAYTPQFISIGPIHRNKKTLVPMEKEKRRYYCEFFRTRLSINTQEELEHLKLREVLSEEAQNIQRCYSEKYEVTEAFLNMILLDSVFIFELFLRGWCQEISDKDYMFGIPLLRNGIQRDLFLLENQLPFFILNKLYDRSFAQSESCPNFLQLAHAYFRDIDQSIWWFDESVPSSIPKQNQLKHFTDLIRCYFIPQDFTQRSNNTDVDQICATKVTRAYPSYDGDSNDKVLKSATKLKAAGVKFSSSLKTFLLDISFKKNNLLNWFPCLSCLPYLNCLEARFQIPRLVVDDNTECILRNLIAFEQCHYPKAAYICCYIFLLDYLIDAKEDVELLVEKKVIVHELGSNGEVADLFNNLGKQVSVEVDKDCYGYLIDELNKHYNYKWNHFIAKLRSVYFCDPWRGSSTVVGIAILIFTFFNFFSSIF